MAFVQAFQISSFIPSQPSQVLRALPKYQPILPQVVEFSKVTREQIPYGSAPHPRGIHSAQKSVGTGWRHWKKKVDHLLQTDVVFAELSRGTQPIPQDQTAQVSFNCGASRRRLEFTFLLLHNSFKNWPQNIQRPIIVRRFPQVKYFNHRTKMGTFSEELGIVTFRNKWISSNFFPEPENMAWHV